MSSPAPRGDSPMRWMAIGLQAVYAFPVGILMGGFIGHWMDERWHGKGYYTLGGVILGIVAGVVNLLKVSQQFMKTEGGPPESPSG